MGKGVAMTALDQQALLAAICEGPEDGLPRLAYADFCEETGDAARAEFVRVQMELAKRANCKMCEFATMAKRVYDASQPEVTCMACMFLDHRSRELLNAFPVDDHRNLANSFYAWCQGRSIKCEFEMRRGFVDRVTLTCDDWMKHGKALVKVAPLTEVRLSDKQPQPTQIEDTGRPVLVWWRPNDGPLYASLPHELWEIAQPRDKPSKVAWEGISVRDYPTEADAITALSQACLKWARTPDPTV